MRDILFVITVAAVAWTTAVQLSLPIVKPAMADIQHAFEQLAPK